MIGRLRGTIASRSIERVVLDVGGVGYEISVSPRELSMLPGMGEEAVLHVHTHVREEALALFGFATEDQRDVFRLLLGIAGVGPKVALAILSTMTPDDLRRAVLAEDVDALTAVPGIGKRSAQKLLLELRPRLELPDGELAPSGSPLSEVRLALEGLGYQPSEIRETLASLPQDGDVEALLRESLRDLGKKARGG
jgi:holliday junction DNA helicase RuvA